MTTETIQTAVEPSNVVQLSDRRPTMPADTSVGTIRMPEAPHAEQLPDASVRPTVRERLGQAATVTGAAWTWRHGTSIARLTALGVAVPVQRAWDYERAGEVADQIRLAQEELRLCVDPQRRRELDTEIEELRARRQRVAAARHREHATLAGLGAGGAAVVALLVATVMVGLVVPAGAAALTGTAAYVAGRREQARRDSTVSLGAASGSSNGGGTGRPQLPTGGGDDEGGERDEQPAQVATAPTRPLLGEEVITSALRTAGLLTDSQAVEMVGLPTPAGEGAVEATFALPGKTTVADLLDKSDRVAKAFRVPKLRMDIREGEHPGQVRLWLASTDPFEQAVPSPLLANAVRQDVWHRGILIGFNRRRQPIALRLRHVMALLGGMSRTGKGMILRSLLCGLALEPRCNIRLVAGAKPGEHVGYGRVCSTFFGRRPKRLILLLEALLEEAYRREEYLEDQGRAKLSEADLDEFPLEVLIIDEYKQYANSSERYLDPSDPKGERTLKCADRIAELLESLAAFAAALNITVLISTQDPDANTIPRGYKSNSGARVSTRTGGAAQTNAILKDGATGAGLRAHDIPESLTGAAIVDIDGNAGELIRGFFIEDEHYDGARPLIDAGVELRRELGRLPGQFADPIEAELVAYTGYTSMAGGPGGRGRPGEPAVTPDAGELGVIQLMVAVFRAAGEDGKPADRLATADLLPRLADMAPGTWSPEALAAGGDDQAGYVRAGGTALRKAIEEALAGTGRELPVRQWSRGGRANGYLWADVQAVAGIVLE
ncbi:hypothetical protein [Streptomyces sp. NBRC 109706]|uniref:hypothetical protein n=1 Tax=Streptomyces sp. NBRC 109706 TaxID=1550035 RepID=UPI000783D61C|nr:hypothetical protein [Streptomyces sp. NBRC 109706]